MYDIPFEKTWASMCDDCPYCPEIEPAHWAKWMRDTGFEKRLHGDALQTRILAHIIEIIEDEE